MSGRAPSRNRPPSHDRMDHTRQKVRSTRATSPPAAYPGQARPFTSDAVSVDKSRKRTERSASGSRTRSAREHKPEAAYRHDTKPSTASSNFGNLSDLRKLLHVATELQKVDLEAALTIYKGLMMETDNDNQIQSEETFLEQLTAGTNTSDRTALHEHIDSLCYENEKLTKEKTALEDVCKQNMGMLDVMKRMETESKQLKADFKSKEDELRRIKEEKADIVAEKNEALTRLSKELGTKLSDNNPTIADLSDPNRAMKLGEKYNELYDNEWTDALETLCRDGVDEERNIKKLLDVLQKCYSLCQDLSEKQMTSLEMVLLNPGASVTPTNTNYPKQVWGDAMISKSTYKQLKDCRKEVSQKAVGNIFKEHARAKLGWIAEDIPDFVKGCIEVCWLMCTQDPPVFIGSEADVGSAFDGNVYKPYTISGTIVSYNVWPPLLLHKNGPLLVKGIVQPIKVPRAKKNTEESKHKTTVVADRLKKNFGETYNSPYGQKSTQRETATKPTKYYEKAQLDRNFTSPPREKYYNGSHTGKNYEELRSHNAVEARGSPVHLTTHSSNYGSRHEPYGTTTQTNYHQDVVRHTSEPYKFEYRGRTYVYKNDHAYPIKEYQQIFGTTRGVSDL